MNTKVVDEKRLTGSRRGLGQLLIACNHIDQAGFADIGPANKGIFRAVVLGTLVDESATLDVVGVFNIHN